MKLIEILTENKLEYKFFPNTLGFVQFEVKAANDAHIALSHSATQADPMYEIFIGGWGNTKSVIRKNQTKPDVAEVETPRILDKHEYRGFWIRWQDGCISVGKEGEDHPFLSWTDYEQVNVEYVGVCTGWGAVGSWIIEAPKGKLIDSQTNNPFGWWMAASNGHVPPGAFVGGEDNGEPMYAIRALFNRGIIPGKLVPSHGHGYVPWGGVENPVPQYEVLCHFPGQWMACSRANIPSNAFAAGQSERGETLYIGRAIHCGALTVGKVHPSHEVLYIASGGREISFREYEILVE